MNPNDQPSPTALDATMDSYERLLRVLSGLRAPEFLEASVTMAQMKVLMLIAAAGEMRMSDMSGQLGVSLSTVSGLVDRLVESGYAGRREDPADRRHVLVSPTPAGMAFIDRFQELGSRRLRELLGRLSAAQLEEVRHAIELLTAAAAQGPLEQEKSS